MANEEDKDYSEENKKRMLVALAIFLGSDVDNKLESYKSIDKETLKKAKEVYEQKGMQVSVEQPARMPEQQVQIKVADLGSSSKVELYKIVGTRDDRTCPDCASWQGKTVVMHPDGVHQTVQDFINNHGFHINCRCSLQPTSVEEIPLNPLNPRHDERAAANPAVYHCAARFDGLVFT